MAIEYRARWVSLVAVLGMIGALGTTDQAAQAATAAPAPTASPSPGASVSAPAFATRPGSNTSGPSAGAPYAAGLGAEELGIVINESDPLSVQIGEYYQQRRGVPALNVVRLKFPVTAVLSRTDFLRAWNQLQARMPSDVQVLALTWSQPFRVECMSITSAFALGFNEARCAQGCQPTPISEYFDSVTRTPYRTFNFRPAMLLAARSLEEARALIDRGAAADGTAPKGTAYLLDTSDTARNKRSGSFGFARSLQGEGLTVQVLKTDAIKDRNDVLFYFTGVMRVAQLRTNRFLPGALADHLTSAGGVLSGTDQMTSLEWLEAGATASFGTVVEPCNFPGKFPNIPLVMRHYLEGETAVESYWKSVLMPSQGLFVGEPLAAPFRGAHWTGIREAGQQVSPTHE